MDQGFLYLINGGISSVGCILGLFLVYLARSTGLLAQKSLLIVHMLVISDLSYMIFVIGKLSYLKMSHKGYNPKDVFLFGLVIIFHIKLNLIMFVGIACERLIRALGFNGIRRSWCHVIKAGVVCTIGGLVGSLEVVYACKSFKKDSNCSSWGCFVQMEYLEYSGLSNGILSIVIIVLSGTLLVRAYFIKSQISPEKNVVTQFSHVYRIAISSISCSSLIGIPSLALYFYPNIVTSALFVNFDLIFFTIVNFSSALSILALLTCNREYHGALRVIYYKIFHGDAGNEKRDERTFATSH